METVSSTKAGVFGLYELSNDGTVLYSRNRRDNQSIDAGDPVVGRDFFYEIFNCKNMEDLRRHFRRFITGDRSADSFIFDCFFEREVIRAKINMTRAYENDQNHSNGIVILDIREAV
jgi:hypothetical protein